MRRTLICCTLALALAGCQSMRTPPRVGPPAPRVEDDAAEAQYAAVLSRWTRRAEIYEGFDSLVFFAATFLSMEFRQAKVMRQAAFQTMPEIEAQALLAVERASHSQFHEFVLGVHANEQRFDDFARDESIWRVALVSEQGEALPASIDRLRRSDPNRRALYPFLEQFWTGYVLRFPRVFANGTPVLPEEGRFTLRFSSTVGKADLIFELEAPTGVQARARP